MIRKWLSEITVINTSIFAAAGAMGGVLITVFGPWNKLFAGLFILMGADVVTGVMKAIAKKSEKTDDGKLSSTAGINGLFKKVGILICILVVYILGYMFFPDVSQAVFARDVTIFGFAFFEAKSILENLNKLGVEVGPFVTKFMKMIKKKVDSDDPININLTELPEENTNEESEELNG